MLRTYFDYNATTPIDESVAKAMSKEAFELFGNPSSNHQYGGSSKKKIEKSREEIAALIGAKPNEIYFTSGGSEANNWVLKGWIEQFRFDPIHVITSMIEHPSVLEVCKYLERYFNAEITYLEVDKNGFVSVDDLERSILPHTRIISLMMSNNEIGSIQPIQECASIAKRYGIFFHTDAVQAVGRIRINIEELGVDALSFSGHKFYGPKGIGGLFLKESRALEPLLHGGSQENGLRSGTENVISIVGLGEASAKIRQEFKEDYERIQAYKNLLLKQLIERIPYTCINGSTDQEHVLNNTVNISFENVRGEAVAALLNQIYGIAVSVGSACSSNKQASLSHVLTAIGLSEAQIRSSIRISIGKYTQKDDVFFLINALEHVVSKLRRMIPIEQNNFVKL